MGTWNKSESSNPSSTRPNPSREPSDAILLKKINSEIPGEHRINNRNENERQHNNFESSLTQNAESESRGATLSDRINIEEKEVALSAVDESLDKETTCEETKESFSSVAKRPSLSKEDTEDYPKDPNLVCNDLEPLYINHILKVTGDMGLYG